MMDRSSTEARLTDQELRDLVAASADAMLLVDEGGVVRFVNPAGETMLGRPAEDITGVAFGRPLAAEGEAVRTKLLRPGGETVVAEMRASPIQWGEEEQAYVVTLRDVEDRVTGDITRLQLHVGGMSHRVSELEARLSAFEQRLRRLEQELDRLL